MPRLWCECYSSLSGRPHLCPKRTAQGRVGVSHGWRAATSRIWKVYGYVSSVSYSASSAIRRRRRDMLI